MRAAGDLCGQLLVLVLLPVFAHAGYERTCFRGQEGPRAGVCGRQLSNMLDFLCDGNFNTLGKRNSDPTVAHIPQQVNDDLKSEFKDKVVLSKRNAMDFLVKRSGIEYQGLTCECCQHQCTVNELRSYCGGDDDTGNDFSWFFKKRSNINTDTTRHEQLSHDNHIPNTLANPDN